MIQDQYEEIFEVVYLQNGAVGVGYRLFNEIFYGLKIMLNVDSKNISGINDYSCLHNKCSEFLYIPIDHVEALAMRKENFDRVMKENSIAKKLKLTIAQNYKYNIQEPLYEHRDETAGKFKNRIDYVNIEAYGVGIVDVESETPKAGQ